MRAFLSLLLVMVLVIQAAGAPVAEASAAKSHAQGTNGQTLTLKEQAVRIPAGSKVKVELVNKEKLSGHLGSVTEDGLVLHMMKAGKAEDRKIAFDELKSIKAEGNHKTRNILIGVGLGVGGLLLVALIALSNRP